MSERGARIRVAVVDDEPHGRAALRAALEPFDDLELVLEAADGESAIAALRSTSVDVVLLDVRMPGLDGFEVAACAAESADPPPEVVFVTASDDHAVRAFEVEAVDYLVKPFDDARFGEMVDRVRDRVGRRRSGPQPEPDADPRRTPHTRLTVREGDRVRFVPVSELRYVTADGNHLVLHLAGGGTARIRHTLTDLEAVLDPARFVRIHRSTLVNVDEVREVQPWFSGDWVALMKGGEELRVSRRYRSALMRSSF